MPAIYHFSSGIKGEKSKLVKPRKTFQKRVKELAESNPEEAEWLAGRGHEFSLIEHGLFRYYVFMEEYKRINSGRESVLEPLQKFQIASPEFLEQQKASSQKIYESEKKELSEYLIRCIEKKDAEMIYEVGRAIEFLKKHKDAGDPYRQILLFYKRLLIQCGKKWPIRTVANMIGWDVKTEDEIKRGFPRLRRLCEELSFPLEIIKSNKKKNKP